MSLRRWMILLVGAAVWACEADSSPPPPPGSVSDELPPEGAMGGGRADADDGAPPQPVPPVDSGVATSGGTFAGPDPGPTLPTGIGVMCESTCDCDQATACRAGECIPTADLVWCCDDMLCPTGEVCETRFATIDVCG